MGSQNAMVALRRGEELDLGGVRVKAVMISDGTLAEVKEGDLYVAERNTGPHLLIAAKIVPPGHGGFIVPTTPDYAFDICDCVAVVEA
ncbi:MAG: hypothetical protein WCT08_02895 [Patescibacteria group bacterium]|jgi:hypothetical protein